MDQPASPQPAPNETQRILGQLEGKVGSLSEQVSGFNQRLDNKEEVDRERHETQRREQREYNKSMFEKIDAINEKAHPTPCPKLMATCADMRDIKTDTKEQGKAYAKLRTKVGNMKLTGKVTWTTLAMTATVIAFVISAILIPVLLFFLR